MITLLDKEDITKHWSLISSILQPAIESSSGEFTIDDIYQRTIAGRTAVFFDEQNKFALTAEFSDYPQYRVMIVCFGAGKFKDKEEAVQLLHDFAVINKARKVITYCKNPAMLRYYQRHFGFKKAYDVLETNL